MEHNYSFVKTLQYLKEIAPKYEFRKPVHLDTQWTEIFPVTSGSFKFGIITKFMYDIQDQFGIQLAYRKNLNVVTVRDFVMAIYKLSHNKIK